MANETGAPRTERLVPAAAAAKRLGVTQRTVRRWIIRKEIAGVRIAGRWYVKPGEVDRMLSISANA